MIPLDVQLQPPESSAITQRVPSHRDDLKRWAQRRGAAVFVGCGYNETQSRLWKNRMNYLYMDPRHWQCLSTQWCCYIFICCYYRAVMNINFKH